MNINTRADLDAIQGTPEHTAFIQYLRGTLTRRSNVAASPDQDDNALVGQQFQSTAADTSKPLSNSVIEEWNRRRQGGRNG